MDQWGQVTWSRIYISKFQKLSNEDILASSAL